MMGQKPPKATRPNRTVKRGMRLVSWILTTTMPSLLRTIRSLQRVGVKEWWRQLQYIGDAKSGTFVGADQCAHSFLSPCTQVDRAACLSDSATAISRTGTERRKFPVSFLGRPQLKWPWCLSITGRHRWVDFSQVSDMFGGQTQ